MSNPDDSSRLSETLERLLGGDATASDEPGASDDAATFEMPEIVPATADPAPPESPTTPITPTLPARDDRPASTTAAPAAPAATPSSAASSGAAPKVGATPTAPAAAAPAPSSWGDHVGPVAAGPQLRAPGRRPRVRRVTRVLRHIDPWSTFKIALLFSAVAYVVALTSGVLLWRVADSTGTLDNIERWFTQFGWETFELQGGEIFRNAWIIGLFGVVFATGGAVLLVTLFNLVSDIVGGIRMTVLEEEVVERTASSRRRYVVRSGSDLAAAASPAAASWSVDDTGDDRPAAVDEPPSRPTTTAPVVDESDAESGDDPAESDATRSTSSSAGASNDWSVD